MIRAERLCDADNLLVSQNQGVNSTFIQVFNTFDIQNSQFTNNTVLGYFDLLSDIYFLNVSITEIKCVKQCFILNSIQAKKVVFEVLKMSNVVLNGDGFMIKQSSNVTIRLQNSYFDKITQLKDLDGEAYGKMMIFDHLKYSKIKWIDTNFTQIKSMIYFHLERGNVMFKTIRFYQFDSSQDSLIDFHLQKTKVEYR